MTVDEFCQEFELRGQPVRSIDEVLKEWETANPTHNPTPEDVLGLEALVAVLVADSAVGDGLLNQISPELLEAFATRRGSSLDSYDEVRVYLQAILDRGGPAVKGVVNQIKGQVGELAFKEQAGGHAHLAAKTNQEAWDIAIERNGSFEYVQVKMYRSADQAVEKMKKVQEKVSSGQVSDGGQSVEHINFAVNKDIASAVREKASHVPGLENVKVYDVPMTNHQATQMVTKGFDHVGPDELTHFFTDLFGTTLDAACLNGMANAFLVYQGAKTVDEAVESMLRSAAFSVPAMATAKAVAAVLAKTNGAFLSMHPAIAPITIGILTRVIVKSWYEVKEGMAEILVKEAIHTSALTYAFKMGSGQK